MTSVSEMMHGVSQQLPSIDQAVTTMSFLAFGIFMANLVVQAVANSSSLSILGREDSSSFVGLDNFPLDFSNLDFDLGLGFGRENGLDEEDKKDILKETADVIREVYVGLHQMAKLSVTHLVGALGTEAPQSRVPPGAEGLPPECLRLLLCEGHRATSPFFRGTASYKLLPFWTVGVSWLSGETNVPRLLEEMRAEVAGQSGLDCSALYPQCEDVGTVESIVSQVVSQLEGAGMVREEDGERGRNAADGREADNFTRESDNETELFSTSSNDFDDGDDLLITGGSYDFEIEH
ncbi:uncharacterized protein LOC125034329 [Penaeus chinensis]|uniref:uncharacterized protein LOC125034329 n=1 Tax=Penaeus chinensis TaxID=139456 RepID=UPI001FB59AF4|nr:uncharacterized protein LOC125034329 [Penaeus chinensis]